jgi:hypothetical protein
METRRSTRKAKPGSNPHERRLQRDLDLFGVKLIKVVGVVGTALCLAIIIAFWYWVISVLYSI